MASYSQHTMGTTGGNGENIQLKKYNLDLGKLRYFNITACWGQDFAACCWPSWLSWNVKILFLKMSLLGYVKYWIVEILLNLDPVEYLNIRYCQILTIKISGVDPLDNSNLCDILMLERALETEAHVSPIRMLWCG